MQLFGNGNKRTALCFANLCLLAKNLSIIVIKDRAKYTNMLVSYYENEYRLVDFVLYLKSCAVNVDITNPNYKDTFNTVMNLGTTEQKVMNLLHQNQRLTAKQIALELDMSQRQIQRILSNLTNKGNIKRHGSDKTGFYEIVKK